MCESFILRTLLPFWWRQNAEFISLIFALVLIFSRLWSTYQAMKTKEEKKIVREGTK